LARSPSRNKRLTEYIVGGSADKAGKKPSKPEKSTPVAKQEPESGKNGSSIDFLFTKEEASRAIEARIEDKTDGMLRNGKQETVIQDKTSNTLVSVVSSGQEKAPRQAIPEEESIYLWFFRADNAYLQGTLIGAYYDPDRNKAVLVFMNDEAEILYWYDKKNHKPYFIVREDQREIMRRIPPDLQEKIVSVESVVKHNALYNRKEMYTKVVVSDPLAVRELRKYFDETWESNIKYYQNYIYDNGLIPGLTYVVNGSSVAPLKREDDYAGAVPEEIFEPNLRGLARHFIQVLEEPAQVPRIMSIDVEVYSPITTRMPDPKKAPYPILSVAVMGSDGRKEVHVVAYPLMSSFKPREREFRLVVHDSEISLLQHIFALLTKYTVIVSYNGDNFDLPYLRNRALALGFREYEVPITPEQDYYTFKGAIHIDLYKVFDNKALKTYAYGGTYRENTLDAVASAILGVGKIKLELPVSQLSLEELAEYNFRDANITFKLIEWKNYLTWKLVVALARLSKTGIEDLTRTQISNWIKNMLYWEHRRRNIIIPTKDDLLKQKGETKSRAIIKGKKYMGAVVLDPPIGVFFNVAVLDFASLYPSIMKVWNLSYETVNPLFPCKDVRVVPEVEHKVCFDQPGLSSQIISLLRDLRVKVYKKKSKQQRISQMEKEWYDVVQASLKVFLNASYGVFGSEAFALYTPAVAESVTAIGRDTIKKTLKIASENGLLVLYGDTDSMFVWSPPKEAIDKLVAIIEKEFKLDLELDKVFRFIAFSGLKKNYLGVTQSGEVVIKGLLGKKRNQPEFVKQAFKDVIEIFSRINNPDEFEHGKQVIIEKIKEVYRKLKYKEYMLDELAFNVMINKPLNEYKDVTPQHIKAALMLEVMGKKLGKGDIISYVKVKGKDGVKPIELAKLTDIDLAKYIETVKSTFEQILEALNVEWKEIEGFARIESFF